MNEFNIICHDHHLSDLYWSETELFLEDYNQAAVTRGNVFLPAVVKITDLQLSWTSKLNWVDFQWMCGGIAFT